MIPSVYKQQVCWVSPCFVHVHWRVRYIATVLKHLLPWIVSKASVNHDSFAFLFILSLEVQLLITWQKWSRHRHAVLHMCIHFTILQRVKTGGESALWMWWVIAGLYLGRGQGAYPPMPERCPPLEVRLSFFFQQLIFVCGIKMHQKWSQSV